jgi:type I restriction-modification system DNA methylase subunit
MAIFQKSVVENFLSKLEDSIIDSAYARFKEVYSNVEGIKKLKEEQYQEGFIRDIFVYVLGYTLQPAPNYNIELEKKNETDSKKADGAILKDGNVIGVIELKDNKTKILDKVKDQAFGYKNNHKGCRYVISSNFQKLRLYVDDATEYEEFDLYSLDRKEFARLFLFLSKEELLDKNTNDKLKEETKFHEEDITNKLYKDYSAFKHKFFNNIVKKNPQYDELLLFKKSQKFLDRILFLLFAEDKKLIPENAISLIVDSWESADDLQYKPLYDLFKIFFTRLNEGHTSKRTGYVIPAYNGGLFKKDEVLDNISVDDEVLRDDLLILSKYDFNTEVDVNILGHIFEHSLTELEEIEAEIKGEVADNQKGKRKKDGVFYTPKYITKYIVENTIGKLCNKKKEELRIEDFDVSEYQNRNGKVNSKGKALFNVLEDYKNWLFELRILDPACGSGAFLNQALSFLIKEHKFIDDLIAELTNTPLRLFDTDKVILEKNIFGVDINDESIEIAKLSLWLRTAQKGRKLSNLSNNIKCGNSLISDVEVAGSKAFDWQKEFPEVFAKGGFDAIIGNPPYVFTRGNKHLQLFNNFIWTNFNHNHGKINLYSVFLELSIDRLLKKGGKLGFITPETFIRTSTYAEIRRFLINSYNIDSISIYGMGVFENVTAETITMIITKELKEKNKVFFNKHRSIEDFHIFIEEQDEFNNTPENRFVYGSNRAERKLFDKLKKDKVLLGDFIDVRNGIATKSGKNNFLSILKESDKYKKLLEAPNLFRYGFEWPGIYINYDKDLLHRPRKEETFLANKILIQRVSSRLICSYDDSQYYTFNSVNNLVLKEDNSYNLILLLGILNSKLIDLFYRRNYSLGANFTITVTKKNLDSIPIPKWELNSKKQQVAIELVNKVLTEMKELLKLQNNYLDLLQSKFEIEKPTKKFKTWYELEFKDFLKELKKAKIQLGLSEEAEWMQYFNEQKQKVQVLKSKIDKTDSEIDAIVYELYDLTEDEIKIVEKG